MSRWQTFFRSLVGKKAIMAVTGLVLFLFVVAHLLGNLKVFEGPAKFDAYAAGLRAIGAPERGERVVRMVERMDAEGFGACTNHGECMAACPKEIRIDFIARLNRDYLKTVLGSR